MDEPVSPIVNIPEIERLLIEQEDAVAQTLMMVVGAVKEGVESLPEDQARELMLGFEDTLRAGDKFYEATAIFLQAYVNDYREKRQFLQEAIAGMAELNGNTQGWVDAMSERSKLNKPSHLRVVRDDE